MIRQPLHWPWVLATLAANHLLLAAAGSWPRSRLLGPNIVRLPTSAIRRREVALTFDDGPDPEVTPHVLHLLDRHGAQASFFCIGGRAAAFPDLIRDIVRRGHSVENHTQHHSYAFACFPFGLLQREVTEAQRTLTGLAGMAPRFFRAPVGVRSPLLDPVLAWTGLRYTSWTRRGLDGVSRDPRRVARRLRRGLGPGDVLLLHDGGSRRGLDGRPVVLTVLPALLADLAANRLRSVSLPTAFAEGQT